MRTTDSYYSHSRADGSLMYQTLEIPIIGVVQPIVTTQTGERHALSSMGLMRLDKFTKSLHVHFSAAPFKDLHDYLDHCYEVLRNMGIVEFNAIDFVFQMTSLAKRWWHDHVLSRPAGSCPTIGVNFNNCLWRRLLLSL